MTDPIAAVVAGAEPDIDPKKVHAAVVTCANPPGYLPKKQLARFTRRVETPPKDIMFPARIKKGIAIKVTESTPPYVFLNQDHERNMAVEHQRYHR